MRKAVSILKSWIPLVVVITLLCGINYVTGQQVLRISANDPQIEMAEDTASELSNGQSPEVVVPRAQVDIATSLAPFIAVYDDAGKAVASSGVLHDQVPTLPSGVFDYVRQNGEDRITWQPEPGVRIATVVTRISGARPGFVMAGRSLRQVENRETQLELLVGAGWVVTCGAALVAVAICEFLFSKG